MNISPIKYESKILNNLASMLKLSEKSDNEIWNEIKEDRNHIKFEIDEDIKRVIDVNKINCTCDESKKKIEEYKGKKFEYYYNVETYGVDFFLDICNALGRSNYKPFLSEEGKKEVMNGLRIRRNSNLYRYVSFFLSKERLNKDRLNDGKTPEQIFHCFKCLRSVLHIYVDDKNNRKRKMYLQDNIYITEEMEEKMENDILRENQKNNNEDPPDLRDGIITVSRYKAELASITRKSNEKIIKTILDHTKNMQNGKNGNESPSHSNTPNICKDTSISGDNQSSSHYQELNGSNTFEENNNYKASDSFEHNELKHYSDSANGFSNDGETGSTDNNAHSKKRTTLKNNPVANNLIQMNGSAGNIVLRKKRERQRRSVQTITKNKLSTNSSRKSSSVKKKEAGDMVMSVDGGVSGDALPGGHPKGGNKSDVDSAPCDEAQCDEAQCDEAQCDEAPTDAPTLELILQGNETPRALIQSGVVQQAEWDKKLNGDGSNVTEKHEISPVQTKISTGEEELNSKGGGSDEGGKDSYQYDVYQKTSLVKNASNREESYDLEGSDDASYSTDDSNYKRYMTRKKTKLLQEGKIVIDLNILNGNAKNASEKKEKEEEIEEKYKERCYGKNQEKIRMDNIRKKLEEKKMFFCKIEEVAKRRNKRHVKTQVLSKDCKIERAYFSHKMKKFYNSKSGYFGCGWSNNKTQWTPFIHAPFFDNNYNNTIYKNRNKKMYEEIYDTLLHGRIHPAVRIVELKDHKHPVRLCTPYSEDCYSVVYTGEKILASDDRVIFGEYTGYVANNSELSQDKHQYMFALSFSKKVFNDRKNVVFINEIESDEEGVFKGDNHHGEEANDIITHRDSSNHSEYATKSSTEGIYLSDEKICKEASVKKGDINTNGRGNSTVPNVDTIQCEKSTQNFIREKKKYKGMYNKIILPDNYTYAVDSSYMFNEMSLVNHYKTCSIFNNYDFRINAEWQLVYLDGWPHIILTSIPGVEINTGEEIFADFGFEWFERVNDICLNDFIKNSYACRLSNLNLGIEKTFSGIDDIVEKYNLIKNHTTCNICMHSVNTDGSNGFIACSGCNHIYHLTCVQKLNAEVNENYDWFCASCVKFCINMLNQEEFVANLEMENHKLLIQLFSDDMCVEKLNRLPTLLALEANDTPLCIPDGKDAKEVTNNSNCIEQYDRIRKLLRCRKNIIDLVKNKEIINSYLENTEKEMNSLDNIQEVGNLSFKKDKMKSLLQNSFELHLLIEYKKKIDDLLLSREKVDTFFNDEKAQRTMHLRKQTINYLLENRKCIEKLVDSMEKGTSIVFAHKEVNRSDRDTTLMGLKEEFPQEHNLAIEKWDPSFNRGESPGSVIKEHTNGSISNSYEKILYRKSNDIMNNLREIKNGTPRGRIKSDIVNCPTSSNGNSNMNTGSNRNLCFNNMMKLSKKILGFPLLTDFERGMSTNQPCLPLSDHLKRLSVCTVCYSKHGDLAKAIICRVTKMHFEPNYNDGLSDEDMFKTSSECVQSIIRELANTIKEYRKRELSGAYLQEVELSASSNYRSRSIGSCSSRGEINANSAGAPLAGHHNHMGAEAHSSSSVPSRTEIVQPVRSILRHQPRQPFYEMMSNPACIGGHQRGRNTPVENNTPPLLLENRMSYTDDYTFKREQMNSTKNKSSYEENDGGSSKKKSKLRTKSSNKVIDEENDDSLKRRTNKAGSHGGRCRVHGEIGQHVRIDPCFQGHAEEHVHPRKEGNQEGEKNHMYFTREKLKNTKEAQSEQKGKDVTLENISKTSNFVPLMGVQLGKTKIQREFTNGTYVGTVMEQIKNENGIPFFVVTYDDGDTEWMTPYFLFQELLKQSTNSVEYPLATTFKEVFNPEFKKDLKLNNCSLELKIERRKRKSNCESASNSNSVSKRQKYAQEENSTKKKKQQF
ncbi:histone-lysine N-methyltransferase, H3 lysine-4 specific, putative [Plasmodium knowlesi strain H]|uniref:Histone-lysine N-methyltransferase, H3 lysine-4 specific, putative n=3 Tax=Plasmodium knowlesi TaxID=5850 RepID=A0A5K1USG5_PLAKH|nr:histone-lysine N-methyltransferase, H3 lysine-4 specific, putative [Plasmodium knowlesi strain H]OTN63752.1 putative Histone-lysine N-methyltransferase - H3 lysine-4 specific [Plasmodium knowlesi]CAA9990997.1 histone-lysine N-methyltransferase, H3 lysine-4 specific, putative [Plasmodium knowlesi strain H]SBO20741.1 histone-lysine N-methyltransferase, H3 lysine-4 specific, putative [Plasmodium knowlesi strain H]SBO21189.1 histone-lysine N-methyltransferase, H3 lysine-4 specific, putative [Pla|eukprot:XP_002262280.1 hypothetical protein, conserved in Plasmodium species [Plasmodium knowlesi strain H]